MGSFNCGISIKESNAIKGVAILAMLWHHLFFKHPEYGLLVHQTGIIGKVCVALFLFVSGYGLTVKYSKLTKGVTDTRQSVTTAVRFILKRLMKFYPNYWIIFIISVPLGIIVFDKPLNEAYGEEANILLMTIGDFMGVNSFKSYNITWWFNRQILLLYVLFPLYFSLLSKSHSLVQFLLAVGAFAGIEHFQFVIGILVALHDNRINKLLTQSSNFLVLILSLGGTIVLCICRQCIPIFIEEPRYIDGFLAFAIIFCLIAYGRSTASKYKVISYLGRHSMNMYLIHYFITTLYLEHFIYSLEYQL